MKAILLSLCLIACATVAAAGDDKKKEGKSHPDFSGTWQLDRAKSDFSVYGDRPFGRAEIKLVVAHKEPELKIERTISINGREEKRELVYYTDERGETNPGLVGMAEIKTKSTWEDNKVVARGTLKRKTTQGDANLEFMDKWYVSGDGKTLTELNVLRTEFGDVELKLVYRRDAE
jgi:hypothetical protein